MEILRLGDFNDGVPFQRRDAASGPVAGCRDGVQAESVSKLFGAAQSSDEIGVSAKVGCHATQYDAYWACSQVGLSSLAISQQAPQYLRMPGRPKREPAVTEMMRRTGARLRLVRELLQQTQEEAAKVVGINQDAWSKIEKGRNPLSPLQATKIAKQYGLTLDFIYGGEISSHVSPDVAANVAVLRADLVIAPTIRRPAQEPPAAAPVPQVALVKRPLRGAKE